MRGIFEKQGCDSIRCDIRSFTPEIRQDVMDDFAFGASDREIIPIMGRRTIECSLTALLTMASINTLRSWNMFDSFAVEDLYMGREYRFVEVFINQTLLTSIDNSPFHQVDISLRANDIIMGSTREERDADEVVETPSSQNVRWVHRLTILRTGVYHGVEITEETLKELASKQKPIPIMRDPGIRIGDIRGHASNFMAIGDLLMADIELVDETTREMITTHATTLSSRIIFDVNGKMEISSMVIVSGGVPYPTLIEIPKPIPKCPDCGKELSESIDGHFACIDCRKLFTEEEARRKKPKDPPGRKVRL